MNHAQTDLQRIVSHLERREWLFRIKVAAMIVFGLPLSLVGPLVLASMLWVAVWRMGYTGASAPIWLRWSTLFIVLTLVMVPLLYRIELRTGGRYLSQAMEGAEVRGVGGFALVPVHARTVLAVATIAANPRAMSAGFVEVFVFGPRLVVGAVQQLKAARHIRQADFGRAAAMLAVLLPRDVGTETGNLLRQGEQLADVMPTSAYLVFHRWIGTRDGWQHVWLNSEARRTLRGAGP